MNSRHQQHTDEHTDAVRGRPAGQPARWVSSRAARFTLAGAATGGLLLLGAVAASAAGADGPTPTPSSTTTSSASPGSSVPQQPAPAATHRPDSASTTTPAPHQPHIDGTVTRVSGTTVTVTDRDGFTRTIVTSPNTRYSDGLTAPLPAGTKIHADGTVDANGTSLDATAVKVAPVPHQPKTGTAAANQPAPPTGTSGDNTKPAPGRGKDTAPATPNGTPTTPSSGGTTSPQQPPTNPATAAPNGS